VKGKVKQSALERALGQRKRVKYFEKLKDEIISIAESAEGLGVFIGAGVSVLKGCPK
jgi:hypothetical protein